MASSTTDSPSFGASIFGGALIFGVLSWALHDVFLLGSLAALIFSVYLFLLIGGGFLLVYWKLKEWIVGAYDIRRPPTPINPIDARPENFADDEIVEVMESLPALEGGILSLWDDQDRLQQYAQRLDDTRTANDQVTRNAINFFNRERAVVLQQQRSVLRRAFIAKSLLSRFKELPSIKVSVSALPQLQQLTLPTIPNYLTPEQYAKKYNMNMGPVVGQLGQLFARSGLTTGNLITAAAVVAIGAVLMKQIISKSVRLLEDSRGKIADAAIQARTTIAMLGRSHKELVSASAQLKTVADEIDALNKMAAGFHSNTRTLSALSAEQRGNVTKLWYWVLSADQIAKSSIV